MSSSTTTRPHSSRLGETDTAPLARRASKPDATPPAATDVPQPRYFFIHVMKTGGRTLQRHFRGNFELDEIYPYGKLDIRYDGDQVDIRHHLRVVPAATCPQKRVRRIRVYSGHFPYVASELLGGDFTRLTVLRDPVERTISLLRQFRRKDPWADPEPPAQRPMEGLTLEQVYENPFVFEPLVHNHQTKIFSMTADDPLDTYMDVIHVDDKRLAARQGEPRQGRLHRSHRALRRLPRRARRRKPVGRSCAICGRTRRRPRRWGRSVIRCGGGSRADNAIDIEFYDYAKELVASRRVTGGRSSR